MGIWTRLVLATAVAVICVSPRMADAACPGECPVPGDGPAAKECLLEYDGITLNFPAQRPRALRCTDGDPTCDADGVPNGVCRFLLAPCINNPDPRFPACAPSDIAAFDVRNKPPGHRRFDPELQALEDAVVGLGLPTSAAVCAPAQPVSVPVKGRRRFRQGRKRLRALAEASNGQKDLDRLRLICEPSAVFARSDSTFALAKIITADAERIEGPLGRSRLGDYLMVNDKIQVAIQKPGRFVQGAVGIYGGNIIDADRHRPDGAEHDNFEGMAPGINIENTANYTSVTVLNDGTNGLPAVVRATGPDDLFDFVNPSTVVAGFGFTFPASADDKDLPIDVQTDYTLEPGKSYVRVDTTLTNTGAGALDIYFAEYLNGSGQVELFQPTYGFGEPLVTTTCAAATFQPCAAGTCDLCNFIAWAGEDEAAGVSYGYVHTVNKSTAFSTSGVSVPLLGQEGVLTLVGASPPNFHLAPSGSPGDALTFTRYFVVGDGSVASITDIRNVIQGVPTGTLRGTVTSGGDPVADTDVAVQGFVVPSPPLGSPSRNVVTHFRTAADGTYEGTLPPGTYTVSANKDGRLAPVPPIAGVVIVAGGTITQDFALPAPGHLRVQVTDEGGAPIPAKIQLVGFDPTPDPGNTQSILGLINNFTGVFGEQREDGLVHGIAFVAFADRTGDSGDLEVEPGSYQLAVSHGPRYSGFTQNVTITAGATTTVPAQIARVIDTPGFISGDWHVHSINSADCEVSNEERVATMLAEGMDFFTPSDHEVRVEFADTIAAMGVGDLITTAPSAEITTFDYGHFNSWPVTVDPNAPNGGSVDHGGAGPAPGMDFPAYGSYNLTPAQIFAAAHADPRANLVQVNHVASFFGADGLDIDTAEGGLGPPKSHVAAATRRLDPGVPNFFDAGFDALEVWIGTNGRNGYVGEFLGTNAGDWFNLLNQGVLRAGVTSSDTHQRRTTQINARSYVASAVTDPGLLSPEAENLAANVVEGRLTGTNAPFVTITAAAASTGESAGLALGEGTLLSTTDGAVDVTVTVASPLWAEFDRVDFYVNNAPQPWNHDGNAATRNRYRILPDASKLAGTHFTVTTVNDFPAISGAKHLAATTTLALTGLTEDIWVVAVVRGTDGVSRPIFPFYPNSIRTATNTTLAQLTDGNLGEDGMLAFAYTNPLYVDVDGGGWSPPGVMLTP